MIRPLSASDISTVERIWNGCADCGEVLYFPISADGIRKLFLEGEGRDPGLFLVYEEQGSVLGFVQGVAPESFRGGKPGRAYLTVLMVSPEARNGGIGTALLKAMEHEMRGRGADRLEISSLNPINLSWKIPGSPGHDHNNMPGLDLACPGAGFFLRSGFENQVSEIAMYLNLSGYRMDPSVPEKQKRLLQDGIRTGPYDPAWHCGFDRMCSRVGSDYWRDVLRTEIRAHELGRPNEDSRMWPDGMQPKGPRVLLTAVSGSEIVGFTGPVDLQKSGRGWFTGICTDPEYEGRGIATVLFNLLMQRFVEEGAQFSTLFTGKNGHARKVYERAGLRPVREFGHMIKSI